MMGRTRVARRVDVQRLGAALKRPGIDTRCWVSLAVALSDSQLDDDGTGAFVDVQLMPTEEELTARLGPIYAGDTFGLFARIRQDDELVVLIPSGETAEGPVVVARLWSAADKVPQAVLDNPEDFVLVIEEGKNLRLVVSGAGQLLVEAEDNIQVTTSKKVIATSDEDFSVTAGAALLLEAATQLVASAPQVLLGSDSAAEALVLGTTYRTNEAAMNGILGAQLTAAGVGLTVAGTDPVLLGLAPAAAAGLAAAGTALSLAGSAVTTFEGLAAAYLSLVSTTD